MVRAATLFIPLFEAFSWFDAGLQTLMTEAGWAEVSRSQTMAMILVRQGCNRPAAIARALGISRQSASTIIAEMIEAGIFAMEPDPGDKRAKIVTITPLGQKRANDARDAVFQLTAELERRIGRDNVANLWNALTANWGPPVESLRHVNRAGWKSSI